MKTSLIGITAMYVVMTSCVKDEVVDYHKGNEMTFRVSIDKALARSGDANVTNLAKLKSFKVTATIDGQANYFTDMLVERTSADTWNTSATYYWPSYVLGFYAYSPTSIGGVGIHKDNKKIAAFTPEKNVDKQVDLLVAYNTGNRVDNELSGVNLNFKHALSQIDVMAKCSNPHIEIVVKAVSFVNIKTTGDFTFPSSVTSISNSLNGCWSLGEELSGPADYKVSYGSGREVTLTDVAASINPSVNNFMLIPQQLAKWEKTVATGAYIAVLCRISSKDGDTRTQLYPELAVDGENLSSYGSIIVPVNISWEAGKKYIYTLNFCGDGGGAGLVDPNPDTTDPSVNPNPKPGSDGGDPVLGNPVKFTVTVEDWMEAPAQGLDL